MEQDNDQTFLILIGNVKLLHQFSLSHIVSFLSDILVIFFPKQQKFIQICFQKQKWS